MVLKPLPATPEDAARMVRVKDPAVHTVIPAQDTVNVDVAVPPAVRATEAGVNVRAGAPVVGET
jgi:hypothetical protein